MKRRITLALLVLAPLALAADRTRPPLPGPPRPLRLPPVHKLALSNGVPVLLAESHEVPVVQVLLAVRAGATLDPADRLGLAVLTSDMLDEGAGGKGALALADALEYLGANLTTGASWDAAFVGLRVPVARLGTALPLLADVALRPAFEVKELERLRKEALTDLLQARDEPRAIASWALARALFGQQHRYGFPMAGTARSVAAIRREELRAFHERHYRPPSAALFVVGDVSPSVLPLLEEAFGPWAQGAPGAPTAVPEPPQVKGRSLWLVDRQGAAQSVIRVGRVGPGRPAADQHALQVMNTLLGGSFTSRLNDNLREQHGYAYGAGSGFDQRRIAGSFVAASDVETQSTAEALGEFFKELRRIRTLAAPDEVERARGYLALSYAEDFETSEQVAAKLAEQWLYALPEDYFGQFVPKALAVSASDVQKAALRRVDPDHTAVVVVGDRTKIEAKLRGLGLGPLRVLALDELMGPAPRLD